MRLNKENKKAQVTVFIITGIIILIGITAFFVLRQQTLEKQVAEEVFIEQDIPEQFAPIADYVENCIKDVAAEALILLGERGGFIDPVASGFIVDDDATESSAVSLAPNWKIPYWHYMASANDQTSFAFVSIPENTLGIKKGDAPVTIEGQLEDYLASKIPQCINLESLENQGFAITPKETAIAKVVVAEEDIVFAISYPIEIERGSKTEISQFFVRIPLNINKIFELATVITYLESNFHFLENYALNTLVAFSGTDKLIPPMSATEFSLEQKTWAVSEVESRIKEALQINIPSLMVSGTANYRQRNTGNSFRDQIYNKDMYISADESVYTPVYGSFSDLSVYFDYLPAELYFDVNCEGTCKPEGSSANWMSLIGIQRYNTIYGLSFPVKVEIKEPVSNTILFGKDHYSFNFMLEVNIRGNDAVNASTVLIPSFRTGTSSITFDENQRTSADITIEAADTITQEPLDEVNIMYTCVDESGYIGKTEDGVYTGKFPVCLGGILTLVKEGYVQYSAVLTTDTENEKTVSAELSSKVTRKVIIKKALMQKTGMGDNAQFTRRIDTFQNPVSLGSSERALVTLTRDSFNEEDYMAFAEFAGEPVEMEIAPGTYEMDLRLFYDDPIVIPPQSVEGQTINGTTLEDGFMNGGLVCTYEIKAEDLADSEYITFIGVSPDLPGTPQDQRELTDLGEIAKIDADYAQYCYQLQPRFE